MSKNYNPRKKKKVTVAVVKSLIRSGVNYPTQLAKHLKVSKQYIGRFLSKMLEKGEIDIDIIEGKGKVVKLFRVKEKRVNQTTLSEWCDGLHSGLHYYSDSLSISYGILGYDKHFIPDNDWKLGKTLMKGMTIDNVFIRIANDKTISFIFPKIYGKDPQDCVIKASIKSIDIRKRFMQKYPDFRLTPYPINYNAGCLGTTKLKPIINDLNPHLPIKTDDYVIDSTPERGSFEMKIKDNPLKTAEKLQKTVDSILDYPNRMDRIEKALEKLVHFEILRQEPVVRKLEKIADKLPELEKLMNKLEKKNKKRPSYVG